MSSLTQQHIDQVSATDGSQAFVGSFNNCNINTENPSKEIASACRNALFLTDPIVDRESLKTAKGTRVEGTCEWITHDKNYRAWLDGGPRLLWISGGPGKGKTMMSIFLTEELEEKTSSMEDGQFICFFCSHQNEKRNTGVAVLRGLVHQIVSKRPKLIKHALPYFETAERTQQTLSSLEALWLIFSRLIADSELGTIFCVLDGLDECDQLGALLPRIISQLAPSNTASSRTGFRLTIVSRDMLGLEKCVRVKLDPDNNENVVNDIERFISTRVKELSEAKALDHEFRTVIKTKLLERAQGTFLWVGFAMHELLQKQTYSDLLEALETLPSGLPAIYSRMLLQIPAKHSRASARILRWVTMSQKPLQLQELAVAVNIQSTPPLIKVEKAIHDAIEICGPLLKVQEQKVSLVHQSAQDYLLREKRDNDPTLETFRVKPEEAHLELARVCLNCISQSRLQHTIIDFRKKSGPHDSPLLQYAALHWHEHARKASMFAAMLFDRTGPFFQSVSPLRENWAESYDYATTEFFLTLLSTLSLLHLSSYLGIVPWVEAILSESSWKLRLHSRVNKKSESGMTALCLASLNGHEPVIRILLDKGARVNVKDNKGRTALHFAAYEGREAVVRLLIDKEARVNIKDNNSQTALHFAAEEGCEAVVRLLIDKGARVDVKDNKGGTALHFAADEGCEAVVRLLIDKGARVNVKDNKGRTALHFAADEGCEAVVRLLIDKGARVNVKDNRGLTALHIATHEGCKAVLQLLLDRGAIVNGQDKLGWTALDMAAERGNLEIVHLLLQSGAKVDTNGVEDILKRTKEKREERERKGEANGDSDSDYSSSGDSS